VSPKKKPIRVHGGVQPKKNKQPNRKQKKTMGVPPVCRKNHNRGGGGGDGHKGGAHKQERKMNISWGNKKSEQVLGTSSPTKIKKNKTKTTKKLKAEKDTLGAKLGAPGVKDLAAGGGQRAGKIPKEDPNRPIKRQVVWTT